jgi:pimeloyl-ACP methyl ester carboxylesterase
LALASSPLSWTGADAFHIVGYSLGGALAASVATYFPHMLKSATLVCPGGLIRPSHVSWRSRIVYSEGLLPEWLIRRWVRQRIAPQHGGSRADVPIDDDVEVDWDDVLLSTEGQSARIGDVMQWQLDGNPGLVMAYLSTIRNAPVYGHHDGLWRILSQKLLIRRQPPPGELPSGLRSGRICLVLATRDPVVAKDEWIEDSRAVLGEDGVDIHIVPGGHEIAITKGKQIADIAMNSWRID